MAGSSGGRVDNFKLLTEGVGVAGLLRELSLCPHLWDSSPIRRVFRGSAHKEVSDILLRFNVIPRRVEDWDELACENCPAMIALPEAVKLLNALSALVGNQRTGRVMITRLPPGGTIYPHRDAEVQTSYYSRFHLCLQADEGSLFRCGGETLVMRPGEFWAFNNSLEHSVENRGKIDRIHLICDFQIAQ